LILSPSKIPDRECGSSLKLSRFLTSFSCLRWLLYLPLKDAQVVVA
jgi:hypothetical protein